MKFLFFIFIFCNIVIAGVWSSSGQDGINQAFEEYNQKVQEFNNRVVDNYESILENEANEVLKNIKTKNDYLNNHKELFKAETVDKKSILFNIEQMKNLTDNEGSKNE